MTVILFHDPADARFERTGAQRRLWQQIYVFLLGRRVDLAA